MKWLAAILMIINVVIFLGVSDRQIENVASQRDIRPDVNKDSMLLLEEASSRDALSESLLNPSGITAPNVTPVNEQAVVEGDGEAGVTTSSQVQQSSEADAGVVIESENTPTSEMAALQSSAIQDGDWSCYRIGPFKEKSLWRNAQAWVTENGLEYKPVRSESRELRAVRVYVGPFDSISAAQPTIETLKKRELDHFVYLKDGTEARVSLGYFTQEELAVKFVDYLVNQEIEAKSQPEYRTLGPFDWMDVRISSTARGLLISRDWGSTIISTDEQPCDPI